MADDDPEVHALRESKFFHLLKPVRDLADNWGVDIAHELEEYLTHLDRTAFSFDGGPSLDFAEAALLIQSSACVYSKKVEYLHTLVYQALEAVRVKRRKEGAGAGADGDEHAEGAAGGDDGAAAGPHGAKAARMQRGAKAGMLAIDEDDSLEAFLAAGSDLTECRDIDLEPDAEAQAPAYHRAPAALLALDEQGGGGGAGDGDAGVYRLACCSVHVSGALLLDAGDGRHYDHMLRPLGAAGGAARYDGSGMAGAAAAGPMQGNPVAAAGQKAQGEGGEEEEDDDGGGMGGGGGGGDSDDDADGDKRMEDAAGAAAAAAAAAAAGGPAATAQPTIADGAAAATQTPAAADAAAVPAEPAGAAAAAVGVATAGQDEVVRARDATAAAATAPAGGKTQEGEEEDAADGAGDDEGAQGGGGAAANRRRREQEFFDPFQPLDPTDPGNLPIKPMAVRKPGKVRKGAALAKRTGLAWGLGGGAPAMFPGLTHQEFAYGAELLLPQRRGTAKGQGQQQKAAPGQEHAQQGKGSQGAGQEQQQQQQAVFDWVDQQAAAAAVAGVVEEGLGAGGAGEEEAGDGGGGWADGGGGGGFGDDDDDDIAGGVGGDGDGQEGAAGEEDWMDVGVGAADVLAGMQGPHIRMLGLGGDPVTDDEPQSYEELCRAHIDSMLAAASARQVVTELAQRVTDWRSRIEPVLRAEETRSSFDLQSYGERILRRLVGQKEAIASAPDAPQPVLAFQLVVSVIDRFEVSRTFAAMLQLINNRNVCICQQGGPDAPFQLQLLTEVQPHKRMADKMGARRGAGGSGAGSGAQGADGDEQQQEGGEEGGSGGSIEEGENGASQEEVGGMAVATKAHKAAKAPRAKKARA